MLDLDKVYTNNQGDRFVIEEYRNSHDILIRFIDYPCVKRTCLYSIKVGSITNPFYPFIFNVGYMGNTTMKVDGIEKKSYNIWYSMLARCYDNKNTHYKFYGANGVAVCDEWLCYATFEKWYDENYYNTSNERTALDKDILIKNNKIYSPTTCIFVPFSINSIMSDNRYIRKNKTLPIGVRERNHKYVAEIKINHVKKHLGVAPTIEGAFQLYKDAREQYIKQVADKYKDKIPQRLYDALYAYEVEITD